MKNRYPFLRKSYAMHRMAKAIERAIEGKTSGEKERAARWAAAWGLLCGIKTSGVRLRDSELGYQLPTSKAVKVDAGEPA
jgi:hypothetical protein